MTYYSYVFSFMHFTLISCGKKKKIEERLFKEFHKLCIFHKITKTTCAKTAGRDGRTFVMFSIQVIQHFSPHCLERHEEGRNSFRVLVV